MREEVSHRPRRRRRKSATSPALAWTGLVASTAAEAYLVFVFALAAIALLPAALGWHATIVQTGSMRPHIDPGDVVVVSPWTTVDPVPMGGVVQFHSPAEAEPDGQPRQRLHRIVDDHDDGTLVTAGDANREVDSTPLEPERITGLGRLLVPFIGLPAQWARTGHWVAFALWAAGTAVALALVYAGFRRRVPDGPDVGPGESGASGGDGEGAAEHDGGEHSYAPGVSRRGVLGIALVGAAAGTVLLQRAPGVSASFSARTMTSASSWSVATLPPLTLGRAASYLLMAHTAIRNVAFLGIGSSIQGSVATSPGTTVENFWPWDISGSTDRNTSGARQARSDALALYEAAGARARPATGQRQPTLTGTMGPGVYTSTTGQFHLSRTLVLDARGDSSALFIFRVNRLTTANNCTVTLAGGAVATNVIFHVSGDIEIAQGSTVRGVYLANASARLERNSQLRGHLFALNGSITLTAATIAGP